MKQQHIHFIGICGVAMSALALAFKKQGWKVTGSDAGFYPPISTHLKNAGIDFYPGWHPEKLGTPDLVVVGNVASSTNPEWLYVQEKKLNYKSYPEVIAEYFVKKNSIVCAGTYGKSTSTTLLTWILKEAEFNPSYMFGGLSLNEMPAAEMTKSDWSVLEGDEYKTSRWDNSPKFSHYSPTHLLLTSVVWDHADVYPTEQKYLEAFKKLVAAMPKNGLLVISEQAATVVPKRDGSWITYGKNNGNDYMYTDIIQSKNGLKLSITEKISNNKYLISSDCLGEYMADNITACFALAREVGIAPEKIIKAIAGFKGMKRRLEKRYDGAITIFDDIAHSPTKAKAILETLRQIYTGKIFAVFEPNTGNRRPESVPSYNAAFKHADEVIIPRLTKIKTDPAEKPPLEGVELAAIIAKTHPKVQYIDEDKKLLAYLKEKTRAGDAVVFIGSHSFRGMIEELVNYFPSSTTSTTS